MFDAAEAIDLFDAMFKRKSVRKFENRQISDTDLEKILAKAYSLFKLSEDANIEFRILKKDQMRSASVKAPYYIAVYAKEKAGATVNAAFMLQQMDLWLSKNGYGSCWLGIAKPASGFMKYESLSLAILLAFGYPAEPAQRESIGSFKRKFLNEITNLRGMDTLLEAARLAPSAMNRQPWYLSGTDSRIDLYMKKPNYIAQKIAQKLYGKLSYIDMGIVLCHLWLSAVKNDRFQSFTRETVTSSGVGVGYSYVWSVNLR